MEENLEASRKSALPMKTNNILPEKYYPEFDLLTEYDDNAEN